MKTIPMSKLSNPQISFVKLQPACSAFSSDIKLPPYFKQYSKGFPVAFKSANLHVPKFSANNFRIWKPYQLGNITTHEIAKLKELKSAPSVPVNQLKAQINSLRYINNTADKTWIYYVGGGTGSGVLSFIVIGCLIYWCCKRTNTKENRLPTCVTYTAPELPNMTNSRVNSIRGDQYSPLGRGDCWETGTSSYSRTG